MTAPASGEASPVEAAAEAAFVSESMNPDAAQRAWDEMSQGHPLKAYWRRRTVAALRAGLAGDWLERVLADHSIESTGRGEVTCRGCRERGWMSWPAFRAHQADAVRAAAGVDL